MGVHYKKYIYIHTHTHFAMYCIHTYISIYIYTHAYAHPFWSTLEEHQGTAHATSDYDIKCPELRFVGPLGGQSWLGLGLSALGLRLSISGTVLRDFGLAVESDCWIVCATSRV